MGHGHPAEVAASLAFFGHEVLDLLGLVRSDPIIPRHDLSGTGSPRQVLSGIANYYLKLSPKMPQVPSETLYRPKWRQIIRGLERRSGRSDRGRQQMEANWTAAWNWLCFCDLQSSSYKPYVAPGVDTFCKVS